MYYSGKHIIRENPPYGEVYNSVTHINKKKNGYHQGRIGNVPSPVCHFQHFLSHMATVHNLASTLKMREPPMGRSPYIYKYI